MKIKIAKYLSQCGVASRRKAEELIKRGSVFINGVQEKNVAERIDEKLDEVRIKGKRIRPQNNVYYILYKPVGYITTTEDRHAEKMVIDLVPKSPKVWPVGRLDKNTSGVLIITNDGELTNEVTHPKFKIKKEYEIITNKDLLAQEVQKIKKGILLDDGIIRPSLFEKIGERHYRMVISEGRNRIVRRIIEKVGKKVAQLKRTKVGAIDLSRINIGSFKKMSEPEIRKLLLG